MLETQRLETSRQQWQMLLTAACKDINSAKKSIQFWAET